MNQNPEGNITSAKKPLITYGTCIPDACIEEDLQDSINHFLTSMEVTATVNSCSAQEPRKEVTSRDIAFLSVVSLLLAAIVCASLVDIYIDYTNNTQLAKGGLRYLLVFSAYTNLSKMFHVSPTPAPGTITCLHCMRVLSMTWVIFNHQQTITMSMTANSENFGQMTEGLLAQTMSNGYVCVETFFFISGLLVAYSVLREMKNAGKFNVVLYFFHRIIRLVPPIAVTGGLVATVLHFAASGPFAYVWMDVFKANCEKNWWKDIVFATNFLVGNGFCLIHTWYLAIDTQLYIIAPLLILPLYYHKASGKAWLYVVTVVSVLIPAVITYVKDLPPIAIIDQNVDLYYLYIYYAPWCRVQPWVAGIWLGYIFYCQRNTRVKMSTLTVAVGWTLAALTGLLVVYGLASYNTKLHPHPYEMMTQVVYGGGHRLAWGAAIAWVVFACHNGYGGVVDGFLSHPVWQPLSRLTYCTYLVAFPIQFLLVYNTRVAWYYTAVNKIIETMGVLVIATPMAALVSLMTEAPILGLEKLLLRPRASQPCSPVNKGESATLTPDPDPKSNSRHSPAMATKDKTSTNPPLTGYHNAAFIMEDKGREGQIEESRDKVVEGEGDVKRDQAADIQITSF